MATTTYTKLKDGTWGLRATTAISGQVTVTKRDGSTKTEQVGARVWHGNGVWLYTIAGQTGHKAHSHSRRRECEECGEIIQSPNQRCWETGGTCFSYDD